MENLENQYRTTNEIENSLNFIKVSCPNCLKLFNVNPNEITETRPKFQCNTCEQKFWIAYPESLEQPNGVIGFPMDWTEEPKIDAPKQNDVVQKAFEARRPLPEFQEEAILEAYNCENCGAEYFESDKECPGCAVVFEKLEKKKQPAEVAASDSVKKAWELVFESYEKENLHQDFIQICKEEGNLAFAAGKYKRIAEACPNDEITKSRIDQIEAIVSTPLAIKKETREVDAPQKKKRKGLPFRISSLLVLLCGVVIAMGFILPNARNLIGIGTSFLFIVLALRFYFRLF